MCTGLLLIKMRPNTCFVALATEVPKELNLSNQTPRLIILLDASPVLMYAKYSRFRFG